VLTLSALTLTTCGASTRALPPCDASPTLTNIASRQSVVNVVAVGDVADCRGTGGAQQAVATLVDRIAPDAVLALGDLAYVDGSLDEYLDCYGPSLGRFRDITRAVPGNYEYHTPSASAYYAYFCGSSGTPFSGYYSFDIGHWHVVALNSVCGGDMDVVSDVASDFGGCGPHSPQAAWLHADLEAHPNQCTLAMFHHPRWSSSTEGSSPDVQPLWEILTAHHVDVVLNGHAHDYQRFPLLNAKGDRDDSTGTRAFIVGTGGSDLSGFDPDARVRSDVRDDSSHGVLQLALRESAYSWRFVPVDGDAYQDAGATRCHASLR
jgi:hypothetical protein